MYVYLLYVVLYSVQFLGLCKWWGCYNNVYKVNVKNVRPCPCPSPLNSAIPAIVPLTKILNRGPNYVIILYDAHLQSPMERSLDSFSHRATSAKKLRHYQITGAGKSIWIKDLMALAIGEQLPVFPQYFWPCPLLIVSVSIIFIYVYYSQGFNFCGWKFQSSTILVKINTSL